MGGKMKNNLSAIVLLGLIPIVSFAYIPADIVKLYTSNNCQKCDITGYMNGEKGSFSAVNLNYSYWTAAYLSSVDFKKKSLVHSNFVVAKMVKTNFDESDLSDSNLSNSECKKCSFKNTKLKNCQFYKAD